MCILRSKAWIRLAMLAIVSMAGAAHAQNVSVSPQRVVIEDGEKYGEMLVYNSGDEPALVRVSLRNMKMTQAGHLEVAGQNEQGLHLADKMIRLAPRQMKVAPKSRQIVRIMAKRPGELEDGEYRTHVVVTVVPSLQKAQNAMSANVEGEQSAINLLAITELVFPAIIRKGKSLEAEASIDAAQILTHQDGRQEMAVRFNRKGNRSIVGDMKVFYLPASNAAEQEVGFVKGVAIYREIGSRLARIPLQPDALNASGYGNGTGGQFRIEFQETRGKGERTEASFVVPVSG